MSDVRRVIEDELARMFDAGVNHMDGSVTQTRAEKVPIAAFHIIKEARKAALAEASQYVLHIEPREEAHQREVAPFVESILDKIGLKLIDEPQPEGEAIRAEDV